MSAPVSDFLHVQYLHSATEQAEIGVYQTLLEISCDIMIINGVGKQKNITKKQSEPREVLHILNSHLYNKYNIANVKSTVH